MIRKLHPLLWVMSIFLICIYAVAGLNFLLEPETALENPNNRILLDLTDTAPLGIYLCLLAAIHATGLILNSYGILLAAYIGGVTYITASLASLILLGFDTTFNFALVSGLIVTAAFDGVLFALIAEPPIRGVVVEDA